MLKKLYHNFIFPLRMAAASPLLRLIKPIQCTDLAETACKICQSALGLMWLSELSPDNITPWLAEKGGKGCAAVSCSVGSASDWLTTSTQWLCMLQQALDSLWRNRWTSADLRTKCCLVTAPGRERRQISRENNLHWFENEGTWTGCL